MAERITIGRVIHPSWNYGLEASLRVHRLLVQRSLAKRWRFKGDYITTGPFESLMGYPHCGSSSGNLDRYRLDLFPRSGLKSMVQKVNHRIWHTLCEYPDLATLSETIPQQAFLHCGDAVTQLAVEQQ